MHLVLIRHARAAARDPRVHESDAARPLLPEGRIEHAAAATALARLEPGITHLIASPAIRARDTAEITAAALGIPPEAILYHPELGTDCTRGSYQEVVRGYPDHAAVALVGHEPCLSFFASEMLHSSGVVRVDFPPSGMLGLSFNGAARAGRAELTFFLHPGAFAEKPAE